MHKSLLPIAVFCAASAAAQTPPHDITRVDPAPAGGAIAVPVPEAHRKELKKYELQELPGARQALGSQLIDGRLPKPLLDFVMREGAVQQRISMFEGGLVVVRMTGAATIYKKVLIPADALAAYLSTARANPIDSFGRAALRPPEKERICTLRVYDDEGNHEETSFHPSGVLPKTLYDRIAPLQDLLRAISEDRTVTSSVAGYEPKPGDELVADDLRVFRVIRVVEPGGVVELKCLSDPTSIYVARKDLHQYFIGRHEMK